LTKKSFTAAIEPPFAFSKSAKAIKRNIMRKEGGEEKRGKKESSTVDARDIGVVGIDANDLPVSFT